MLKDTQDLKAQTLWYEPTAQRSQDAYSQHLFNTLIIIMEMIAMMFMIIIEVFDQIQEVYKQNATLLGSPLLPSQELDGKQDECCTNLTKAIR
jgi:hypothetical protein